MLNIDIEHVKLYVNESGKINIEEITKKAKSSDLIISSSTGTYIAMKIAYDYNIPLISLNGVISYDILKKTFKKLNYKIDVPIYKKYSIEHLILRNKDDEIINYCKDNEISGYLVQFETGGHKFNNIEETKPYILDFIKKIF